VLVKNAFHGGAGQFSVAVSAFGCGGLLGALGLLAVDARRDRRTLGSWGAVAFALTLIGAALVPWYGALLVLLVLAGAAMSVTNTSTNTVVQSHAAAGLRGQAVSLYMLAMRGGLALGGLATGLSAHLLGIRASLLLNGVLAIAAQALIGRSWSRAPQG
jgi:MFS family permease